MALVDPNHSDVLYFLYDYLFSLNMAEEKVKTFIHEGEQPLRWRSITSWDVPPWLASGKQDFSIIPSYVGSNGDKLRGIKVTL